MKFELDNDQITKLKNWNHDCKLFYEGAIGGSLTYQFTDTNLGRITVVKCACGAEIDLTNYEYW